MHTATPTASGQSATVATADQPAAATGPAGGATPASGRMLTRVLTVDSLASAATGALLAGGSGVLDELLGIPSGWLLGLGVFLLAYAVDVALVAGSMRRFVPVVIAANAMWVVASVVLVVAGGFELTALGIAFVLAQAAVVAAFAVMQGRALRPSL